MKSDLEMGLLKENNQVGDARGAFSSTYHVQDLNVLDIDTFFAPLCFMKPHKKT